MRAEKTVNGISRDYRKFATKLAIIKNRLDLGQAEYNAREKGHAEGQIKR